MFDVTPQPLQGKFMEQRRLRPGDRLDDYCPRERRLTDHVVVAVVDDVIKQTRCVACDAEHVYKDAKVPPRRKKKEDAPTLVPAAAPVADVEEAPPPPPARSIPLFHDDADDEPQPTGPLPSLVMHPERRPARGRRVPPAPETPVTPVPAVAAAPPSPGNDAPEMAASAEDDGPVHRRLIRATLPRIDGQGPERRLPEFTVRQPGARTGANGFNRGGGQGQPRFGKGQPRGGHGGGFGQGSWNGRSSGHGGPGRGMSAQGQGGQGQGDSRRPKHRSRNGRKKGH